MYFYVLPGPYRVGFGITNNWTQRQKDYTGAWGAPAVFAALWQGPTAHVKTLEDNLKTQHRQLLWRVDTWTTEWFDNGWNVQQVIDFVQDQITRTHLKLQRTGPQ